MIIILSYDEVSAFLSGMGEGAKLKFVDGQVNLSFLKFGLLWHCKLHGHVCLARE